MAYKTGTIYSATNTASADTARQITATPTNLAVAYISVATQGQTFGNASAQTYAVAAGGSMTLSNFDVSTLWFKNTGAGSNGTVNILGVQI
jgi:hypothetical protein